jgi:hypothetical protein
MNDFLFTFSSKQLSISLPETDEKRPRPSMPDSAGKAEIVIKNIRTKKLKRYDKLFEPNGIRKHLSEHEN